MVLLFLVPFTVFAAQQKGSIELTMREGPAVVAGGTVTLYCVTDWHDTADAKILADYAQAQKLPGITQDVGKDGKVTFGDLEPGQYLLVQGSVAAGYLPMNPFCVSVPMAVGEELIYNIEAAPKLERIPEPTLPQTGQLVWPIWALLGGGFGLIGLGFLLQKRK